MNFYQNSLWYTWQDTIPYQCYHYIVYIQCDSSAAHITIHDTQLHLMHTHYLSSLKVQYWKSSKSWHLQYYCHMYRALQFIYLTHIKNKISLLEWLYHTRGLITVTLINLNLMTYMYLCHEWKCTKTLSAFQTRGFCHENFVWTS